MYCFNSVKKFFIHSLLLELHLEINLQVAYMLKIHVELLIATRLVNYYT